MSDAKPNKRYRRVQAVIDMIEVKAGFQARCFDRDLKQAIKDHQDGDKDLTMGDILRIVHQYPLQRNRLLARKDLDEEMREFIRRATHNPDFDPDEDD